MMDSSFASKKKGGVRGIYWTVLFCEPTSAYKSLCCRRVALLLCTSPCSLHASSIDTSTMPLIKAFLELDMQTKLMITGSEQSDKQMGFCGEMLKKKQKTKWSELFPWTKNLTET